MDRLIAKLAEVVELLFVGLRIVWRTGRPVYSGRAASSMDASASTIAGSSSVPASARSSAGCGPGRRTRRSAWRRGRFARRPGSRSPRGRPDRFRRSARRPPGSTRKRPRESRRRGRAERPPRGGRRRARRSSRRRPGARSHGRARPRAVRSRGRPRSRAHRRPWRRPLARSGDGSSRPSSRGSPSSRICPAGPGRSAGGQPALKGLRSGDPSSSRSFSSATPAAGLPPPCLALISTDVPKPLSASATLISAPP